VIFGLDIDCLVFRRGGGWVRRIKEFEGLLRMCANEINIVSV
jgi:hypothetical protein